MCGEQDAIPEGENDMLHSPLVTFSVAHCARRALATHAARRTDVDVDDLRSASD